MTPEMQLKTFIDSVNDAVGKLRERREKLNDQKIEINSQIKSLLEGAVNEAKEKVEIAYGKGKSHIDTLAPKGEVLRDKTSELHNKLQGFVEHYSSVNTAIVLPEEARGNISEMLSKPEEVVGQLTEFRAALCEDCAEFNETILGELDDFDQHVDDFVGHADCIQGTVTAIENDVIGHLDNLEECITQANSLYETTVSQDHEVLVEKAVELLFDKIEIELSKGMEEVNGAIAKLNESGLDALTNVTAAIGEVNDTLEDAIKITEPVKPVLEMASSIA